MIGTILKLILLTQLPQAFPPDDQSKPPIFDQLPYAPPGVKVETRTPRYYINHQFVHIEEYGYYDKNEVTDGSINFDRKWIRVRPGKPPEIPKAKIDALTSALKNERYEPIAPGDKITFIARGGSPSIGCSLDEKTLRDILDEIAKGNNEAQKKALEKKGILQLENYTHEHQYLQLGVVNSLSSSEPKIAKVKVLTGTLADKTVFIKAKFCRTPLEAAILMGLIEEDSNKVVSERLAQLKKDIDAAKKSARIKSSAAALSIRSKVYQRELDKRIEVISKEYNLSVEQLKIAYKMTEADIPK